MASVNKTILIGHCGKDPEIRYLPSGMAVANVSLATTSKRKDKNTGEYIEETQWHRLQFFERTAEIVGEYVKKGSMIYVEGRIKYGKYTDKDGIERNTCDIVCSELTLLGGKNEQNASNSASTHAQPAAQHQAPAQKPQGGGSGFEDMDDDIPLLSFHACHDPLVIDRKAARSKAAR